MYAYIHTKSVKSVCSSRISRASQSPNKVEKQPKSTPDMQTLPPMNGRGRIYTYPRGHSLLLFGLYSKECCEDSEMSQTTSINAFLCYVLNYYAVEFSGKFYSILFSFCSLKSRSMSSIEGSEERKSFGSILPSS